MASAKQQIAAMVSHSALEESSSIVLMAGQGVEVMEEGNATASSSAAFFSAVTVQPIGNAARLISANG